MNRKACMSDWYIVECRKCPTGMDGSIEAVGAAVAAAGGVDETTNWRR